MFANVRGMSDNHLESYLEQYRVKLAHKLNVVKRHQPGTTYHTRATRDAAYYQDAIRILETEINRRKEEQ